MLGNEGTWSDGYNSGRWIGGNRRWVSTLLDKPFEYLRFHVRVEMPGTNLDAFPLCTMNTGHPIVLGLFKNPQNNSCVSNVSWTIRDQMCACSSTDMSAVMFMIMAYDPASRTSFLIYLRTSLAIISSIGFKMSRETHLRYVRQSKDCNYGMSLTRSYRSCVKLLSTPSWPCTAKPWHAWYWNENNVLNTAVVKSTNEQVVRWSVKPIF